VAKLSSTMIQMLANLTRGDDPKAHCHGRSEHGGAEGTIRALVRRKLATWGKDGVQITEAGRQQLELYR
jgi:hypothetical protein